MFFVPKPKNMINEQRNYTVFMHLTPELKAYIGITKQENWNKPSLYRSCVAFYGATKQFGWENTAHYKVEDGLTKADAIKARDTLIKAAGASCYNAYQTSMPTSLNIDGEALLTKNNGKMKKAKKETKRSCRISSVKIELMFDNRYKRGDGTYPVCVRVYNDKKYAYLQTGYSMSPAEFECMDADNEASLNKMYERVCAYVREKTNNCAFCIDCVKADIEKKMQGITNTSGTLASLIMEKAALLTNSGSATNYRSAMLRVMKTYPNGLPLAMTNQHSIGAVLADLRKDGYSDTTINIYLSVIKASINYGIYKGLLKPEQYPFKRQAMEVDKVVVPKSNKRDDRYITKQEMQQLWGWFKRTKNKWVGYFMFSYLHGGMNLADMMDLRFNDFWFTEGGFVFTRKKTAHKTNHKVLVPATTWTQELFDTMGIVPTKGARVFNGLTYDGTDADYQKTKRNCDNNINRFLDKACLELGISKNVSMTTARHSFATIATRERIPYTISEQCMGHVQNGVSSHYIAEWQVGEMRADMEKLL